MTRLVYTCNHLQSELANLQRAVRNHKAQHKDAARALDSRVQDLEQTAPRPEAGESSSAPSAHQLEERVDHVVAMLGDINAFAAPAAISQQLGTLKTEIRQRQQPSDPDRSTSTVKHYKMPTFRRNHQQGEGDHQDKQGGFTREVNVAANLCGEAAKQQQVPRKQEGENRIADRKRTASPMGQVSLDRGGIQVARPLWLLLLVQQHQAQDLPTPGSRQRGCSASHQLGKLSCAGGEATPPLTPPDSVALLATSYTSGEDANFASSRYTYEDYAVHLVPPLDQPLHVQHSTAFTVSPPSTTDSAASPPPIAGDSTSWSRLEELDPLTFADFQWMPVPPTGRLPKPHCNVLMAQLRDYVHTAVPTSLMDAGVEVLDLHNYIAKIDREFNTQRYDDIDAALLYVRIQIEEATCSTLIDCGASRNYMSHDLMVRAGLGPHVRRKSQPTQVTLADGHTHKSIDRCIDDVPVYFAPHASEAVSFDILDTKFDMILGMSWLRSKDHPVNFYRHTIYVRPHGVVPDRPIRHEIILEDGAVPPRGCIYRMSEEEVSVLRAKLDDLLEKGWIRPSSSPYGAPVLFVRKKNTDLRLCIDYRKLNEQMVKNADPLPRIDNLLERLGGAKFFSKLDLKSGYHQLEIRQEDHYKTTFKTRYGHFEWLVMSFGLTNAPGTFQATMTTNRSLDEHVEHLRTVLERLRQAKYKANRDKCEFAREKLEYLGHYVTPQGIRALADKIEAIRVWPEPTNTTDVSSFVGLAGYYQRFITGYSRIAAPMTRLQSPKVPFIFDDGARRSFQTLKTAMLMAPVLSIYDPTLPTRVTTDASGYGIGAVLEQHDGDD
ncbi:hypothetical protein CBR_g64865 [Chara braunii]|uniref:Reverse transcriptase domain-containing protein n=1 Tax=Chara braunii TaxID=69332 RepID=A0A388K958_CHABU|nr:hypothetical protein CBR_g64865 [Chara braunii]|eukprot:GBG66592.1 hypothetical protein CBR_g64865 [Chara braunii]